MVSFRLKERGINYVWEIVFDGDVTFPVEGHPIPRPNAEKALARLLSELERGGEVVTFDGGTRASIPLSDWRARLEMAGVGDGSSAVTSK